MTDPAQTIDEIRRRVTAGEKVPREEMRAALDSTRRSHEAAALQTVKRKAQPERSADELLDLLDKPAGT